MNFDFIKCNSNLNIEIPGLFEINPKVFADARGQFLETYNKKQFEAAGLKMNFVQDNQSTSTIGVLRGLHFQTKHPQGKLIRAVAGRFYDVAVDLRKNSPTFGQYCGIILDSEKNNQFYIPEGFAHGFYVLSDKAVCSYKCTDFYDPSGESGLMWNDKSLNIIWPLIQDIPTLIAEKDNHYKDFNKSSSYFDNSGKWLGNN